MVEPTCGAHPSYERRESITSRLSIKIFSFIRAKDLTRANTETI